MTSKAQLLARLEGLRDEKRHRKKERELEYYQPHRKQELFHNSPADVRLLLGGNRSGKSTAGITEDVAFSLGYRPWNKTKTCMVPSKGIIYAPDFENSHKRTTIPKLKFYIPPSELSHTIRGQHGIEKEFHFKNGSIIFLGSYDQKLMKAESADWDWIHFDEPPPRQLWIAASRGLMDREGKEWHTLTPLSEPWIYDELYCKAGFPDVEVDRSDDEL